MKKSKKYFLYPILLGFTCFYLLSMILYTYLKAVEYKKTYEQNNALQLEHTAYSIFTSPALNNCDGTHLSDNQIRQLKYYVSDIQKTDSNHPISMALYDTQGHLVAQTTNLLTANAPYPMTMSEDTPLNQYFDLNDYLTDRELSELASYCHNFYSLSDAENEPSEQGLHTYRLTAKVNASNWELSKIYIYETFSSISTDSTGLAMEGTILRKDLVWSWENPVEIPEEEITVLENDPLSSLLPYMEKGLNVWLNWNNNASLHNYPPEIHSSYNTPSSLTIASEDSLAYTAVYPIVFAGDTEQSNIYMLVLSEEDHSFSAAIQDMRYIYIFGFIVASLCICFVWLSTKKIFKKQQLLEESRRDFTNAIAHELKTPLSVIRGFSENLKENIMEEKKDYYLEQIIEQTEEMDQMVQEMICISKLDSDQLPLHRESLSLLSLLEAQFDKLDSLIQEKNLVLQIRRIDDFIVIGDKSYLEKALWNLASNAVSYSRRDGTIQITCTSEQLTLENTGKLIDEKDLPHVFDMFYTGDSSRSSEEKHLGLGLYLAKKIFDLHHLNIFIQNAEDRVQVSVHV